MTCLRLPHALAALALLLASACGPSGSAPCQSSLDCAAPQVCDFGARRCVQCVTAVDCLGGDQICNDNLCQATTACTSSRQCPGLVCDLGRGYCVECLTDLDCPGAETCDGEGFCLDPPSACQSDSQCTGEGLVCDVGAMQCVECVRDTDCVELPCIENRCRRGAVDAGPRDAGPPGVDAGPRDAGPPGVDAGPRDAGPPGLDAGPRDAGPPGTDAGPRDAGPPSADAGRDGGPLPVDAGPLPEVFIAAHSADFLYRFSAQSESFVDVGAFYGATAPLDFTVVDIAVRSDGRVFATLNDDALYTVDMATAELTRVGGFGISPFGLMVALTFLHPSQSPDGTEMLLGANQTGEYYSINTTTGVATLLGVFPDGYVASGDLVSVAGLGVFAVLKLDETGDVLASVTFLPGGASSLVIRGVIRDGVAPYTRIFGLAYGRSSLYGFTDAGELLRINPVTALATAVPTPAGVTQLWGAGVTPLVP